MKLVLRVLAAGGLATALVGTMSAAADAATADSTVTATRAAGPGQRTGVITCKITTRLSRPSRRVKASAGVQCSGKVKKLTIRVKLYKNNALYKKSVDKNYRRSGISESASGRCVSKRNYAGVASGTVVFPDGYSPHSIDLHSQRKTVYIGACGK